MKFYSNFHSNCSFRFTCSLYFSLLSLIIIVYIINVIHNKWEDFATHTVSLIASCHRQVFLCQYLIFKLICLPSFIMSCHRQLLYAATRCSQWFNVHRLIWISLFSSWYSLVFNCSAIQPLRCNLMSFLVIR